MTKTPDEVAALAASGKLLASVFDFVDRLPSRGSPRCR